MRYAPHFFERGSILPITLVASAFLGFMTLLGFLVLPVLTDPLADMRIEPNTGSAKTGDTFTIEIVVESSVPVNVFAGDLLFDSSILAVESIDYNTSIADLWAKLPWYSNGDGTLNFAGGTTRQGGFLGTGTLITVTFKTLREGGGSLVLKEPAIFRHDGLGTEAALEAPLDALVTVTSVTPTENIIARNSAGSSYTIVTEPPSTDLNGDGKQSIADVSIFMLNMRGDTARYDFNLDGAVTTKDLSILLNAK